MSTGISQMFLLARGKAGGHLKQVKKHTEALDLIRQLTGIDC